MDSVRSSSFLGQILSFRTPKWYFFQKFLFRYSFLFALEFIFAQICATFQLKMGQWARLHKSFIFFRPNSINFAYKMAFFWKFLFRCWVFLALVFKFTQICAAVRLKIGQRVRLRQRFILFQPNSIVSASKMAFFQKFLFWCSFYFAPKFRFANICAAFRLEMGQWSRLFKRFIFFWRNSIVLASEMAFVWNFLFRSCFILRQNSNLRKFVQLFDWKWVNKQDSTGSSPFFALIPSSRPPKWHFFENFCFGAPFFFAPKFRFMQFSAAFFIQNG